MKITTDDLLSELDRGFAVTIDSADVGYALSELARLREGMEVHVHCEDRLATISKNRDVAMPSTSSANVRPETDSNA